MKSNQKWMSIALAAITASCIWNAQTIQAETEPKETVSSEDLFDDILTDSETVYVLCKPDGAVRKVMAQEQTITDLQVNKDGTSSVEVTNIDGDPVSYNGDVEKDLPVTMDILYELDGKSVEPADMAGKSGHVKITYLFESNESAEVDDETVTVPYLAMTGLMLDTEKFSNIEISNGKYLEASGYYTVAGLAFPGLSDALGSDEIPASFTVEADVEDFSISNSMSVITNSIFDLDDAENMDEDEIVDEIMSQVDELIDGTSELYDGVCELYDGALELDEGVGTLADGATELASGAVTLNDGALTLLSGANSLSSGLAQLSANNDALVAGAQSIFQALITTADTTLADSLKDTEITIPTLTESNYNEVLSSLIDQMGAENVYNTAMAQAKTQVEAQVEASSEEISAEVTAQVKEEVTAQVTQAVTAQYQEQISAAVIQSATGLSVEEYNAAVAAGQISEEVQEQISAGISAQMEAKQSEMDAAIEQNVEASMSSTQILEAINENIALAKEQLVNQYLYSQEVQEQVQAAVDKVSAAAGQVASLKGSLNSVETFYTGLVTYTQGVASAAEGAAALATGAGTLQSGTASLVSGTVSLQAGVATLQSGTGALVDGVYQLKEGAMQLNDGILGAFDEVDDLKEKLEVVVKAVQKSNDNYSTSIKFIYKTDEIKNS